MLGLKGLAMIQGYSSCYPLIRNKLQGSKDDQHFRTPADSTHTAGLGGCGPPLKLSSLAVLELCLLLVSCSLTVLLLQTCWRNPGQCAKLPMRGPSTCSTRSTTEWLRDRRVSPSLHAVTWPDHVTETSYKPHPPMKGCLASSQPLCPSM